MSSWSTGYSFNVGQGVVANGFWYIPNEGPGTLSKTDLNGTIIEASWCSGLTSAQCCVEYGGDLYVATSGNISKVTLTEPPVVTSFVVLGGGIGLTVNADYLYVANGSRISRISLVGGTDNLDWAIGMTNPAGLAISGTDLYTANISGDIYKIPLSTGVFDPFWTINVGVPLLGLDVYGTNLYVSQINNNIVCQVSLTTKAVTTFTAIGGSGRAVVVYAAHVYASYGTSTIGKFSISDLTWSTGYSFNIGGSVVANGHFYLANSGTNAVVKTNLDGTINDANYWGVTLSTPSFCAVSGDYLYVSNRGNGNISKLSLIDPVDAVLDWVTLDAQVLGLAVSGDYLYAVNYSTGNISKILLSTGAFTLDWGQVSTSNPHGLAAYGTNLYVSNYFANNISQISLLDPSVKDLNWVTGLNAPIGLAVYGTNLYVGCSSNVTQISFLDKTTSVLAATGSSGLSAYDAKLYVSYGGNTVGTWTLDALPDPPVPPLVCFKEGSKILTDKGYVVIQDLRKGDLVKTVKHGFMPIDMIGKRDIVHHASKERIKDQLYKCSQSEYPELFEPLVITGCHAILVDEFVSPEQREQTSEVLGRIFVTDKKYRLPACVDTRASVYEIDCECTIYHLALENEEYFANYGIYANGLLVETCSKRYLKELSNMTLIE